MSTAPTSRGFLIMPWYHHPQYKLAKQHFISDFSPNKLESLHHYLPKVIFICGGKEDYCPNRKIIEDYFKRHIPEHLTFRAEDAWAVISKIEKSENSLNLEEWLASFSDVVMILVESFGTVAELGAFSLNAALRKKLLPILNKDYEKDDSFINTGPVAWVNNDSRYSPCIQANYETILTCMPDIKSRMSRRSIDSISNSYTHGAYKFSSKVMLFFLLHILVSLGPISIVEIISISNNIISFKSKKTIQFILSVGVALKIFGNINIAGTDYYYCIDFKKLFYAESAKRFLHSMQSNRTSALSYLLNIEEFRFALDTVNTNVA